jgi:hypothetical protein
MLSLIPSVELGTVTAGGGGGDSGGGGGGGGGAGGAAVGTGGGAAAAAGASAHAVGSSDSSTGNGGDGSTMTPREVKAALAELTRPPRRGEEGDARALAHRTLMELGASVNVRGDVAGALRAFEAAWRLVPDDGVALLSAANMHAKLGHAQLAVGLYQWLLRQPRLRLPPHAASMAQRKLQELAARGVR